METMSVPTIPERLIARYGVAGPRYTSYPTAPEWQPSFGPRDLAAALTAAAERPSAPLSLYVHIPFCRSLCWYCGCNVVISREAEKADRYLDHLERELDLIRPKLGKRQVLSQVHWGGGTPTFLGESQIARLWNAILQRFEVAPGAEVAIEVHPALTTRQQLIQLRTQGFNRLSMGLQDFDARVQQATHRTQTFEQTRQAITWARELGFGSVNLDLIYGLPFQDEHTWARTLEQVLALGPDRVAVYSFAYLPEVLKHQRRMPKEALPPAPVKLALFNMAYAAFLGQGYRPIGMDHFARPDDELARAQSERSLTRNFQGYTVQRATDVVAVGASAISDVGGRYAQNVRAVSAYYDRIGRGELATDRGLKLTAEDLARRRIISSLMCNFWVDLGPEADRRFARELEALERFEADQLVQRDGTTVQLTALGRLFVRNVAMVFDTYLGAGARKFSQTV